MKGSYRKPNRSTMQQVRLEEKNQSSERALTPEKSRSKRHIACSDVVDPKGFKPSTSRMRRDSEAQFVVLSGCFQPFRLESEWSCVLLCQMFPPAPETSVVCVVVMSRAPLQYSNDLTSFQLNDSANFDYRQPFSS